MRKSNIASGVRREIGGFTLIELIVATTLMVLVIVALGAVIGSGIRVWSTAQTFNAAESEALIGVEVVGRDIANAFQFHAIPFSGGERELSFANLVEEDGRGPDPDVSGRDRIGTVKYFFDGSRQTLFRRQWIYPGLESEGAEKMVTHLREIQFLYYQPPEEETEGVWLPEWSSESNLPARVSMRLLVADGDQEVPVERVVVLPVWSPYHE